MPEVSVLVAACDAGRTIDAALHSVLAQTFRDFELIVVDDGSSDDTAVRVAAFGDRVTCIRQPRTGRARAWDAALRVARGSIVAFLDPSHLWMPRKLERQVRHLETHPEVALVFGNVLRCASPAAALRDSADTVPLDAAIHPDHVPGSTGPTAGPLISTIAVRRAALDEAGQFDASFDSADAERTAWARIGERHQVSHVEVPVAVVREGAPSRPATARASNLLHDTRYRRLRHAVTRTAHGMDDVLHRRGDGPRRVLFEAASPMSLAVFGPVLRQLRQDTRLDFWFTSCSRTWPAQSIFGAAGITDRVVPAERVRWTKFDAYINTDFWDMTWLPRRTSRIHFFHGVAGKYGLDAPVRIAPVVATFDRLMFPNRDRLRRYAEAGIVDADSPQAALIGYPKVDCLVDGSLNRTETLARLGLDLRCPTVLYAPTWSPYSSLNQLGESIVSSVAALGVNLIVKLHDRSYDATTRGSGGVDWSRALHEVCARTGAHLVRDSDASPWLHAADLLITDHSSVGFEFMLLDRPIVVVDVPDLISHARINPDKVRLLRSAAFVAAAANDIARAVREGLDHPAAHRSERRRVADDLFYCPGTATARAVQCIYDLMALPAPGWLAERAAPARAPALAPLIPIS